MKFSTGIAKLWASSNLVKVGALAGISLFSLTFQNCGAGFSSSVTKSSLLAGASVFASGDGLPIPDGSGNCYSPTGAQVACPATPTPTPTPVGYTPTPTPVGYTPTPTPVGYTPTPTPFGQTPTPTPIGQTPTPTPRGQTPTPTPINPTPTPVNPTPTPTPTPVVVTTTTDVPVEFYCSSNIRNQIGTSLSEVQSQTLTLTFVSNGTTVCSMSDDSIRTTLINQKKFSIPNISSRCPNLTDGRYTMYYGAANQNSVAIQVNPGSGQDWFLSGIVADVSTSGNSKTITPVVSPRCADGWANGTTPCNWFYGVYEVGQVLWSANVSGTDNTNYGAAGGQCDASASPLIVSLSDSPQTNLVLTPPLSGIKFDIEGGNAKPTAYAKKQISWLDENSRKTNYFVVLPNSSGQVNGIDEMFGNNTAGPTATKYAANGYAALAKWDGRKADGTYDPKAQDGIIDSKDAVFKDLRLWNDLNGDGIAQENELHTLESLSVEAIDLAYDPSYKEVDKYGNKVLFKSVVKTRDGNLHLIFDIWFRLVD